jgi:hypothetical protein
VSPQTISCEPEVELLDSLFNWIGSSSVFLIIIFLVATQTISLGKSIPAWRNINKRKIRFRFDFDSVSCVVHADIRPNNNQQNM